jgi:prepilin-type N-terminal cleavage/methylation domain-containing protein
MKHGKGFTLIELLVVISIIALLLSLLMPSLGKAKNLAMIASCSGQLKQWGVVVAQYTNDNKSMYWQGWRYNTGESSSVLWFLVTWKYYQNPDFLFCPAAKLPMGTADNPVEGAGNSDRAWGGTTGLGWCQTPLSGVKDSSGNLKYWRPKGSYGQNGWTCHKTNSPSGNWSEEPRYWRTSNVKGGDKIPLIGDAAWHESNPEQFDGPPPYKDPPNVLMNPGGQIARFCIDRHKGKDVWVFVDSSVRPIGIKGLFAQIWHKDYKPEGNPYTWSYYGGNGNPSNLWPDWMKSFKEYMGE